MATNNTAAARKARAQRGAETRARNKAAAQAAPAADQGAAASPAAQAAPAAAKPVVTFERALGSEAVIAESNERGKIIGRAEYLHLGTVQYQLAYTRADGCYDERWFAAGQLSDFIERRAARRAA